MVEKLEIIFMIVIKNTTKDHLRTCENKIWASSVPIKDGYILTVHVTMDRICYCKVGGAVQIKMIQANSVWGHRIQISKTLTCIGQ